MHSLKSQEKDTEEKYEGGLEKGSSEKYQTTSKDLAKILKKI